MSTYLTTGYARAMNSRRRLTFPGSDVDGIGGVDGPKALQRQIQMPQPRHAGPN